MDIKKSSGLIFHPTSLPGNTGIGELNKYCFEFIDLLKESKTSVWQVLPLGYTDEIEYSPYSSKSSLLGNPYIVSLADLNNQIVEQSELNELSKLSDNKVDFKNVYKFKKNIFQNLSTKVNLNDKVYESFLENDLVKKHLTFMVLSEVENKSWNNWKKEYSSYTPELFEYLKEKYPSIVNKYVFLEYEFQSQWQEVKNYANAKNIAILGDIPIYVNHNSADVWLNKNLFDLNNLGEMEYVSGAVPDDFTVEGQVWNTALYKWEEHIEDGYKYWVNKINSNLQNYNYLRIDHFVGFFKFWAIPFGESALKGHWRKGPWENFFEDISKKVDFEKLLAEDLGVVLDETDEILTQYDIPGMKVLQQRIPNELEHDEIHPEDWKENVAAYTGTHDSPTISQWFDETNDTQLEFFEEYSKSLSDNNQNNIWKFISMVWNTPCKLAITTVQDLLELDISGRFNFPGTVGGNWEWRLESLDQLVDPMDKLKELNLKYNRSNT
jgi:4-alpha-glucanotransferase